MPEYHDTLAGALRATADSLEDARTDIDYGEISHDEEEIEDAITDLDAEINHLARHSRRLAGVTDAMEDDDDD